MKDMIEYKLEKYHNREPPESRIPKPLEIKWINIKLFYDMDLKLKMKNLDTGEIISVFDTLKEYENEKRRRK